MIGARSILETHPPKDGLTMVSCGISTLCVLEQDKVIIIDFLTVDDSWYEQAIGKPGYTTVPADKTTFSVSGDGTWLDSPTEVSVVAAMSSEGVVLPQCQEDGIGIYDRTFENVIENSYMAVPPSITPSKAIGLLDLFRVTGIPK